MRPNFKKMAVYLTACMRYRTSHYLHSYFPFVMHDVGGMKFKEIALIVEKPLGTVLARYNRSIRKLRKTYQGK